MTHQFQTEKEFYKNRKQHVEKLYASLRKTMSKKEAMQEIAGIINKSPKTVDAILFNPKYCKN